MARVSFTLRRESADKGSYLRYDDAVSYESSGAGGACVTLAPGARTDYDSALRADGLQIAPEEFTGAFFEATSTCYGEVDLSWGMDIAETLTSEPQVMSAVLVYSDLGEPQTIASGTILVDSSNTYSYTHHGAPEGRWAYYSLFVNYRSSGGDNYFEQVAELSVLVPRDYGSTLLLWERIPEYYRIQDTNLGIPVTDDLCLGPSVPLDATVGPLFRFLSIFGFDMDKMRTLIDYTTEAKDPFLANSETLDAIADLMSVDMRSQDLGAARLRNLINDIGYFHRSKGTEGAIEFFAKAISGCDIRIDQADHTVTVFSQRVNYITSPQDGAGIVDWRPAHANEHDPDTALAFSNTSYDGFTADFTYTDTVFDWIGANANVYSVMIHVDSAIPVRLGDHVVFSVHSGVGTTGIVWARAVDAAGNVLGVTDTYSMIEGAPTFEIVITDDTLDPVLFEEEVFIELLVDLKNGATTFGLSRMLAERNYKGIYFDGDTVRGGWLIDASSVSDYRWSGSDNDSVSIYTEDYERTKAILDALLFDAFPITQADLYSIVKYNGVPGVD